MEGLFKRNPKVHFLDKTRRFLILFISFYSINAAVKSISIYEFDTYIKNILSVPQLTSK